MVRKKENVWKDMFRLTKGKIALTILLLFLYLLFGVFCGTVSILDGVDVESGSTGFICGESIFHIAKKSFSGLKNPLWWIVSIAVSYIISSIIIHLFRKKK